MRPHTAPVQQIPAHRAGSPTVGHLLAAAIVALIVALAIAYDPATSAGSTPPAHATARTHAPAPLHPWVRARLSHYGTCTYVDHAHGCDGYLGKRTACGKIVRTDSNFVAALTPDLARCGLKITVLYRGRKAWRSDDRHLDAAPGLRARLGFTGVARISYRKGWQ